MKKRLRITRTLQLIKRNVYFSFSSELGVHKSSVPREVRRNRGGRTSPLPGVGITTVRKLAATRALPLTLGAWSRRSCATSSGVPNKSPAGCASPRCPTLSTQIRRRPALVRTLFNSFTHFERSSSRHSSNCPSVWERSCPLQLGEGG